MDAGTPDAQQVDAGAPDMQQRADAGAPDDASSGADAATDSGEPQTIEFSALAGWTRRSEPVLRDPFEEGGYEVAGDAHVFRDESGTLRMVYSGDINEVIGPKLATATDWGTWAREGALFAPAQEGAIDRYKETPFYRRASDGTHQIFYIGYPTEYDEEADTGYEAQIFVAESQRIEGPYEGTGVPAIAQGTQAGREVYSFTSPSVIEHDGELLMAYLAWNDNPGRVTEIWVMGAVSRDDGRTWGEIREIEAPIGMEGQITRGPDGLYYATSLQDHEDSEAIFLARAPHPFGPYESLPDPVLVKGGAPWEVDESTAPQIAFDPDTRTAYLYYAGADYTLGWWIMLAETSY